MSEWISARDRLPDKPGRYLVVINPIFGVTPYVDVVHFEDRLSNLKTLEYRQKNCSDVNYDRPGWWKYCMDGYCEVSTVTNWMPLPEKQKEG